MVARVFAPSHLTIDAGDRETLRQRGAEQKMIDAQTGIASKGVPEILPEGVDPNKFERCRPRGSNSRPASSVRSEIRWPNCDRREAPIIALYF